MIDLVGTIALLVVYLAVVGSEVRRVNRYFDLAGRCYPFVVPADWDTSKIIDVPYVVLA